MNALLLFAAAAARAKSTDFDVVLLRTGRRQLESFTDFFWRNFLRRSDLVSCFYAAIAVGCLTVFNFFLRPQIGAPAVLLVYFLAVLILSLRLTRNAVFVSAGLAALAWNYFFITPLYTLHIERLDDTILFFLFFAVAFVAAKLRTQRETGMIRDSSSVRLTWSASLGPACGASGSLPRGFLPASRWALRLAAATPASTTCW